MVSSPPRSLRAPHFVVHRARSCRGRSCSLATAGARYDAAGRHAAARRLLDRRNRRQQRLVPSAARAAPSSSSTGRSPDPDSPSSRRRAASPRSASTTRTPARREPARPRALGGTTAVTTKLLKVDATRSLDQRRGDDRPERRGLVPNSGHAPVERHRRDLGDRLLQPAADVQQPGHDRHEQERQLYRQRREHVGRRADGPLRLDASRHAGAPEPGAELERLASVGGHRRLERFGHDLGDRLVQRSERLQRARHAPERP